MSLCRIKVVFTINQIEGSINCDLLSMNLLLLFIDLFLDIYNRRCFLLLLSILLCTRFLIFRCCVVLLCTRFACLLFRSTWCLLYLCISSSRCGLGSYSSRRLVSSCCEFVNEVLGTIIISSNLFNLTQY